MLRPRHARDLTRYDNELGMYAALDAWRDPGSSNYFTMKAHYILQNVVRSMFPILARALDRAVYGEYFLTSLEYRNGRAEQRARDARRGYRVGSGPLRDGRAVASAARGQGYGVDPFDARTR